jgi:hypothetical protein
MEFVIRKPDTTNRVAAVNRNLKKSAKKDEVFFE